MLIDIWDTSVVRTFVVSAGILIQNGKVVDADNVEVISEGQLSALSDKFQQQLHFS